MIDHHDSPGDEFEEIASLLTELTPDDIDLLDPPDELWDLIEAEVSDTPRAEQPLAPVVSLDARRRFPARTLMVGAVAAVAVLVVGFALGTRPAEGPTVVASAELTYDPANFDPLGSDAQAEVVLVDDGGTLRIDLEQSSLPRPADEDADLELWLIEPDADGNPAELVSLGLVDPDRPGDFAVPATTDPSVFSVVDISVEPRDGVPTHSGRSILRGSLTKA
ncbi:MAG TPA: anti-sigma factor [Acidimicrobiales bacterium]|nr:anti-sigma factor [Acidimicrobiales bacterium]